MLSKTTIGLPIHILALLLIPQNNACGGKTSTVVEKSSLPRVIERGDHYQKLAVDGDYVQSRMRFPETIGIFTRAQILDFESRELGHSVMYKSQMGTMAQCLCLWFRRRSGHRNRSTAQCKAAGLA